MVAMTRQQWQAEIARLFVNNTTGDIEADEVLQVLDDLADSVTFGTPTGTALFRTFSIDNVPTEVDSTFTLSGQQTFHYPPDQ